MNMALIGKRLLGYVARQKLREKHQAIYRRLRNHTMISEGAYVRNLELVETFRNTPGRVVECGTWRGGMIAGIAITLGKEREYLLFDSFEGLPPAQGIDGETALRWQADTSAPDYFNNCTASEESAAEAMRLSGASNYRIIKGWFSRSLPSVAWSHDIAVLRLDGDWYESTMDCLEALFPHVTKGGIIIIDDYYAWEGCAKAVHDYLSRHQRPERIRQHDNAVCFMNKA